MENFPQNKLKPLQTCMSLEGGTIIIENSVTNRPHPQHKLPVPALRRERDPPLSGVEYGY